MGTQNYLSLKSFPIFLYNFFAKIWKYALKKILSTKKPSEKSLILNINWKLDEFTNLIFIYFLKLVWIFRGKKTDL